MADAKSKSIEGLFATVRAEQDASLRLQDSGERARAKARLLQAIDQVEAGKRPAITPAPTSSPWRWGLGALAASACALALIFTLPDVLGDDTLAYEIDGVDYAANQMIRADDEALELQFSDDSSVVLAPGSQAQVSELRDNGATVYLDQGEVDLAVHHESDTSWQVVAGPWAVHVTGTQFTVTWEPELEYFRVAVSEGSVRVEGVEGELAKLRAGESLVRERGKATIEPETREATETTPEVAIAELDSDSDDAPEADTETDDEPEADTDEAPQPRPTKPSTPTWVEHFDSGAYELAWQALDNSPGGIHAVAKQASARTLLDLADVARFTKHADDAATLLEQLRDEHPGSSEAAEAAFALGRQAMDRGARAKAATHFEAYLDETPKGAFASDALRRLMDCYAALGREDDARLAAERYLAEFPKGAHATKAQSILSP